MIQEACTSIGYKFLDMKICSSDGFKYIECDIDTEEKFQGVMIGFILDIRNIIPEYDKESYYLPVVMFCTTYQENIKKLLNKEITIKHELMHVRDVLDMIEKDPKYTEKVAKYSMNNDTISVKNLPKSIEFEIFRLFNLEPQASEEDYKNGENYVLIPLKNGEIYRIDDIPLDKYIRIAIASDIERVKNIYLNKFPRNPMVKKIILHHIRQAVKRHGKKIFGSDLPHVLKNLQ
ncbi:MAG: hypothetical protein HQL65_05640 [Magnetococcales bacterium]|nr:hypothetical protein [Magnetococcales bacterium]